MLAIHVDVVDLYAHQHSAQASSNKIGTDVVLEDCRLVNGREEPSGEDVEKTGLSARAIAKKDQLALDCFASNSAEAHVANLLRDVMFEQILLSLEVGVCRWDIGSVGIEAGTEMEQNKEQSRSQ